MKKVISPIFRFIISAVAICCMSLTVYGAGKVTFQADSGRFIFEPGSSHSPTDLFSDFKELMPGDSIEQAITVKNSSSYGVKVKLYVRSNGANDESVDFLSKLHLTVAKSEDNKMSYMFDAAADQTAGMTDWVYLGTLYSGGEVDLILKLDIPIELGNEYQDTIGYINWEFKADELLVEPGDPVPPQTGVNGNMWLYITLASVSGIALTVLWFWNKKKTVKEQ